MDAFTPLVNLFAILTALSLAAERITNIVKLRSKSLRDKAEDEKDRERRITSRALLVSLAVALLVKADFFEILSRLDAPWETLGWARMQAGELVRTSYGDPSRRHHQNRAYRRRKSRSGTLGGGALWRRRVAHVRRRWSRMRSIVFPSGDLAPERCPLHLCRSCPILLIA